MFLEFFKIITAFGLTATKFLMGTGLVLTYAYSFWQAFLLTFLAGMTGFFTFAFFSKQILEFSRRWRKKRNMRTFTRFNRSLVKIRQNNGLAVISLLTPVFLTVPVGTFMATSLKANKIKVTCYMTLAFLGWSLLLTGSFSLLGINLQTAVMNMAGY